MHARTVTFQVPSERLDDVVANIREGAQNLVEQKGFHHAHWLYDREGGTVMAVALFDNAEDEAASWEVQGPRVRERLQAQGITLETRTHEVVHEL